MAVTEHNALSVDHVVRLARPGERGEDVFDRGRAADEYYEGSADVVTHDHEEGLQNSALPVVHENRVRLDAEIEEHFALVLLLPVPQDHAEAHVGTDVAQLVLRSLSPFQPKH